MNDFVVLKVLNGDSDSFLKDDLSPGAPSSTSTDPSVPDQQSEPVVYIAPHPNKKSRLLLFADPASTRKPIPLTLYNEWCKEKKTLPKVPPNPYLPHFTVAVGDSLWIASSLLLGGPVLFLFLNPIGIGIIGGILYLGFEEQRFHRLHHRFPNPQEANQIYKEASIVGVKILFCIAGWTAADLLIGFPVGLTQIIISMMAV